jgi:hypothetical protein
MEYWIKCVKKQGESDTPVTSHTKFIFGRGAVWMLFESPSFKRKSYKAREPDQYKIWYCCIYQSTMRY